MRETDFIKQNRQKWADFERTLTSDTRDPEKLNQLFVETTEDLSHSQTYYRRRSVKVFLNGLAQQVFQNIYKNSKKRKNAFSKYWKTDLPLAMSGVQTELLIAFLLFAAGCAIGIYSTIIDPTFPELILGKRYVADTAQYVADGDPMHIYKKNSFWEMFGYIAQNNLRVMTLTAALGIFFSIGTVFIVLYNAVMVGAFVYMFVGFGDDVFQESFITIMQHGTLELSCIVLSGAAGLRLGKGLIFPQTYSRWQSFLITAKQGIYLLLGISPVILFAAFIESYLTRQTEMHDSIRLLVILVSLGFIVFYYIVYPKKLAKSEKHKLKAELAPYIPQIEILAERIKPAWKLFSEATQLNFHVFKKTIWIALGSAAAFLAYFYYVVGSDMPFYIDLSPAANGYFDPRVIWVFSQINDFTNFEVLPYLSLIWVVAFSVLALVVFQENLKYISTTNPQRKKVSITVLLSMVGGAALLFAPFFLSTWIAVLVAIFSIPIVLLSMAISHSDNISFFKSIGTGLSLFQSNFVKVYGTFLSSSGFIYLACLFMGGLLMYFFQAFILINIEDTNPFKEYLPYVMHIVLYSLALFLTLPGLLSGFQLLYFSSKEASSAEELKWRISQIGVHKKAYGLERE